MNLFKRGGTFAPTCEYQSPPGTPASIAGMTITSQIRSALTGQLIAELTASAGIDLGVYTFDPVDTSDWPIGDLNWDIVYEKDGVKNPTETIVLTIVENITR